MRPEFKLGPLTSPYVFSEMYTCLQEYMHIVLYSCDRNEDDNLFLLEIVVISHDRRGLG